MRGSAGTWKRWRRAPFVRTVRRGISALRRMLVHPVFAHVIGPFWAYTVGDWTRWSESGPLRDFVDRGAPVILCAWHQDIVPCMGYLVGICWRKHKFPMTLMVGDGEAGTLGGMLVGGAGVPVFTRPKRRHGDRVGAVQQLAEMCARTGVSPIITGDGSRGPAFAAKWGAIYLARDTGFPLIPLRTRFARGWQFKHTWARFMLPPVLAWGRAHVASGEPLYVPADADKAALEACRRELERRLIALMPLAEAYLSESTQPGAQSDLTDRIL